MSISLFITIMGIFWLFAEGLVMVYVRKAFIIMKKGEARQKHLSFFYTSFSGDSRLSPKIPTPL
jgi:hypothetical protein